MRPLRTIRRTTRFLAKWRGLRRITEKVQGSFSDRAEAQVVDDFDGNLKFRCFLDSHISSWIFWAGSYSGSQLELLGRILSPDMVFFDVGANEGEHTVFAAKRLARGRVHSFEPNSEIAERLDFNVRINGFESRVTAVRKGLGEAPAKLPLYGATGKGGDGARNEGLGTLFQREGVSKVIETIELIRLDDYVRDNGIARLDVMKVDVEGSELAVLKGGVEAIRRFRPVIFMEVSEKTSAAAGYPARALLEFLQREGYQFETILPEGGTRPLRSIQDSPGRDVVCRVPTP